MNKFFFNFIILILVFSCTREDDASVLDIIDLDGKNLYAAGYYIDSYPNGTQYATYWLNGKRRVLGEGEISDIEVKDGISSFSFIL